MSRVQGESFSGQESSWRRRGQQRASSHRQQEAASRQRQLLITCMKLKEMCTNGKLKQTSHTTIMEQLRITASTSCDDLWLSFRKRGALFSSVILYSTSHKLTLTMDFPLVGLRRYSEASNISMPLSV